MSLEIEVVPINKPKPEYGVEVHYTHKGMKGHIKVVPDISRGAQGRRMIGDYTLNWCAHGSMPVASTALFQEALKKAMGIARRLTRKYSGKAEKDELLTQPKLGVVWKLFQPSKIYHAFKGDSAGLLVGHENTSLCKQVRSHRCFGEKKSPGPLACASCERRLMEESKYVLRQTGMLPQEAR